MQRNSSSSFPITDVSVLGYGKQLALGTQHVFTLFASTVLVPIITGLDVGVALVMSGIGTLLFHVVTQRKVPAYLGSSFSFIAPILLAADMYGLDAARGGIVVAGLVYCVFSLLIAKFGPERVLSFFPPVVTGPVIIVISMTLAPNAINMASEDWLLAMVTLAVIIAVATYARGFLKIVPVIVGLGVGYLFAVILDRVDFAPMVEAAWVGVPNFALPKFHVGAIAVVAPIALVTIVEHVGDVLAVSGVVGKPLSVNPGLSRTMLGDGLATAVSAMVGGPANTTYSQNTGVVALTKVHDPKVMRIGAVIVIALGLVPKLTGFTQTIPSAVLGGAVIVLFGMIASIGAKTLVSGGVDYGQTRNMIITAVILVFGLGGAVIPVRIAMVEVNIVGMALAALIGVVLNKVLPHEEKAAVDEV